MNKEQAPPFPTAIDRLRNGVYAPMAMLAGMQLELFTPLAEGPMTAAALAEALGVSAVKLRPLLYALVTAELLTVADGRFANTAEADHYLVKGRPAYLGGSHELLSDIWQAVLQTAETVRSGRPQARHAFDAMPEAELHAFLRGLHGGALAAGRQVAETLDLARRRHLLDVGGGSGGLAIGACESCPALRSTVTELPQVAPITRAFLESAGMAERIAVLPADVTQAVPEGSFDVAVLRNVLQVLSAEQAGNTIANVGRAVEPGGHIHIIGRVLDDSRLAPPEVVTFNLVFLNVYDGGQAFTEGEHREWLGRAGFGEIERRLLPDGSSTITARKTGDGGG